MNEFPWQLENLEFKAFGESTFETAYLLTAVEAFDAMRPAVSDQDAWTPPPSRRDRRRP